jgi:hypothetical protein
MEFQMMQKIQDDEARILAEQHETQISGVVLGGFPRTPPAASEVQHPLEASSTAFMEISKDENRAAVGESAGGSTIPNEVQFVTTQHDEELNNKTTTAVDYTEAPSLQKFD